MKRDLIKNLWKAEEKIWESPIKGNRIHKILDKIIVNINQKIV